MKTTFLQLGLLLAMGIVMATFSSCNRDEPMPRDNSVIIATNVVAVDGGSTDGIFYVRKQWCRPPCETIAEAPFQNNGFILQLPETIPHRFLSHISDGLVPFGGNLLDFTITGSLEARWLRPFDIGAGLVAFDKSDVSGFGFGSIVFQNHDDNTFAFWTYVTNDIAVFGETEVVCHGLTNSLCFQNRANLRLNKGWNLIYIHTYIVTEGDNTKITRTFTSQRPSDRFSWTFTPFGIQQ